MQCYNWWTQQETNEVWQKRPLHYFYCDTSSVMENSLYFVQRWVNLLIGITEPGFQSQVRYNNLWLQ